MILFGLKEAGFGVIETEVTDKETGIGQNRIIDVPTQKGIGKDPLEDIIGLRAEDRKKEKFKVKRAKKNCESCNSLRKLCKALQRNKSEIYNIKIAV